MANIGFELILLTIERDLPVLSIGLPYIIRFIRPSRIRIIASSPCLKKARELGLNRCGGASIDFLDEDKAVPGLDVALVRDLIAKRGGEESRAGWYFKQILNLAYSLREETSPFYLTWDADSIPVRGISFFDPDGRVYMTMKKENHAPYFATSMNLIGIGKVAERSFIAEHMMFERDHVRALLKRIDGSDSPTGASIAKRVIGSIAAEDLSGSGFAEYEIYGSFMFATARKRIALRTLPSSRHGTALFGRTPSDVQLFTLSRRYYWASFEDWRILTARTNIIKALRRIVGSVWTMETSLSRRKKYNSMKAKIASMKESADGS